MKPDPSLFDKNFVQNLIDQVAKDTGRPFYSDYLLDLFDAIDGPGGGGYQLQKVVIDGRAAGGTVDGSMSNIGNQNPPTVLISPNVYFNPIFLEYNQTGYISTALHETIHLAPAQGWYSDRDLARATINLGGLKQTDVDQFNNISPNDSWGFSAFWDRILNRHCRE